MYKNVVALISSEYYNSFEEEVPLTGEEFTGYIAVSAGGTHATDQDIIIELMEDRKQFDLYNWSLFDADSSLYAQLLHGEHYEIPDYTVTIPAAERTGKTMVRINPDGLSHDSTSFIALKMKSNPHSERSAEHKSTLQ